MSLSGPELKQLELALADRIYLQLAGWHLSLGEAGLA